MARVEGVVAAGSQATAQAGVEALQAGGNAVDAAVAAALSTAAGEPPLTSLAGGGVLLHRDGSSGQVTICDFSPDAPGLGAPAEHAMDFFPVQLQFGPASQTFHIGRAAAAVPGGLHGLMGAHGRWGSLPLPELVAPACRLLREGVQLDDFQQACIDLLEPILTHSEGSRQVFAPCGELLGEGRLACNPLLAETLEELAELGWEAFRTQVLDPAVLADFGTEAGGCITEQDLAAYQPDFRKPLTRTYRGTRLWLPPKPAAGGTLIALGLALLEAAPQDVDPLRARVAAMRVMEHARGLAADPLAEAELVKLTETFTGWLADPPATAPRAPREGATTHISVLDAAGNAAAVTISHGEGNGYAIGRTGIIMNNMMGEADLHPDGFHKWPPGKRLATMMSPALLQAPDGALTVLGTGGANRIRTAILQVIANLVERNMEPQAAVEAARMHWEGGQLNAETFDLPNGPGSLEALLPAGERLVPFDQRHLFFGGVHVAQRAADGGLSGGGDPRRSGVVLKA